MLTGIRPHLKSGPQLKSGYCAAADRRAAEANAAHAAVPHAAHHAIAAGLDHRTAFFIAAGVSGDVVFKNVELRQKDIK